MTTQQIISQGEPVRRTLQAKDTFTHEGKEYPKFDLYEIDGEEFAVPTKGYTEYLQKKEVPEEISSFSKTFETYLGKDSPKNIEKLKRFISEFKEKYHKHSIYLWSRFNSTQKTTSAKIVMKEISEQGFSTEFVLANSLVNDLKNYEFVEEARGRVEKYKAASFLVIDDSFSGDKVTKYSSGYQVSFLDTFLRERLEVFEKATCFTSNIPVDEIADQWGASIGALVTRNVFPMEFNDVLGKDVDFDVKHIFD